MIGAKRPFPGVQVRGILYRMQRQFFRGTNGAFVDESIFISGVDIMIYSSQIHGSAGKANKT